ncbi:MAG: tetratricopeptide repeat protein, partial [Dehalococcoidia bacterium]|nr:tetratricopeptide repeat protein [Dehalococcoidia bacterium]
QKGDDVERAEGIFHWLWRSKPHRYEYRGNFKLTDALDAQLGEMENVGNCLGLTVLYNVLAQRFGLEVKAAHLEDAFGIGPHVFTVLCIGMRSIDIDNIFPYGFNYRGHKGDPLREEWGDRELIADIYHSMANDFFERGEWESAIENYDKSIRLHPKYTKARLNKGIALVEMGRVEEAREWFRKATQ